MENRKYSYDGKDIKQYVIQSVVVVDSVHMPCGKYPNGAVRYGYSSPYKAGLIVLDRHNYHKYFLDGFNSIYFLRSYLKSTYPEMYNTYIRDFPQMYFSQFFGSDVGKAGLIINNIPKVIVKDLDKYLSNNRILSLKRNSKKMVKMGENSEYLDFV